MEIEEKIDAAEEILALSLNLFGSQFGYFAYALEKLSPMVDINTETILTDGNTIRINPLYLLNQTAEGMPPVALLLHTLLHVLFLHPFKHFGGENYSLAADICVCRAVDESGLIYDSDKNRMARKAVYKSIIDKYGVFNERYAEMFAESVCDEEKEKMASFFKVCDHSLWGVGGSKRTAYDLQEKMEVWGKIAVEAMKASKVSDGAFASIVKANAGEKYDYKNFLRKFLRSEETVKQNAEEFDLIYYCLGLNLYGNVPLVENLEYREDRNLENVVIAIDTSGSTKGEPVKRFLEETYSLISNHYGGDKNFGVRIIQCDSEIRSDVTVRSMTEFQNLMENFVLTGGGGTDFRPVFDLLEDEKKSGKKIKGLIYFTDGEGAYPQRDQRIKTCFAVCGANAAEIKTPYFAYRIELGGIL